MINKERVRNDIIIQIADKDKIRIEDTARRVSACMASAGFIQEAQKTEYVSCIYKHQTTLYYGRIINVES